jgi:carboxyl-terminal processing protease
MPKIYINLRRQNSVGAHVQWLRRLIIIPTMTMTQRNTGGPVALAICLLFGGCGSRSTSSDDCSIDGVNQQTLATLRSWYYWSSSIPTSLDAANFDTPQHLLDAVRQNQPLDRFSFVITKPESDAFFGAGQYLGYGFGYRLTADNNMQLTDAYPGSPAASAQMARGDTITAVDGTAVPTLIAQGRLGTVLAPTASGSTATLEWTSVAGEKHTATLTATTINQPSVERVAVLSADNRNVGYVLFNSFIDPSSAQLDVAFQQLGDANVSELIIDERYNGGGELSVAQHLASLIAGNDYSGKTLGRLSYNDRHPDQNQALSFRTVSHALALRRVFFITTNATASASEFLINALRPYIEVVTIGESTFGKPVGENGFFICNYAVYPITFKIENSQGAGDYFGGLAPTCGAADDLTHPLGDKDEAAVAAALQYMQSGTCTAQSTAQAARRGAHGWREMINAY